MTYVSDVQRTTPFPTDMCNPDPTPNWYTSLAWATVLGHEDTFQFLLTAGHDEEALSKVLDPRDLFAFINELTRLVFKDSENNTILMLLVDFKPLPPNPYAPAPSQADLRGAALCMARLYYDRFPWILDRNSQGKTALHMAALKGNEELVRVRQRVLTLSSCVDSLCRCFVTGAPTLMYRIITEILPSISMSLVLLCQ